MRLFATGLMQRVMDKSFEDDVPLESKMVSKAVERAQGTVEDRNFEIRKDVLKYDEVMNEQRKIIYRRRQQILDGEDLRDAALDAIESTIGRLVQQYCGSEYAEEWNTEGLLEDARTHFPTRVTKEQLDAAGDSQAMEELLLDDATALYAEKEESIGAETLRDIERRVMLSVIDQHWREHLYEMDYLQEGINLRAMGQQDPLSEWQREGFDMFEAMMGQIADDFVQYVFHLQVVVDDAAAERDAERAVQRADRIRCRARARSPARWRPQPELRRWATATKGSRRRGGRAGRRAGAGSGREDAGPQRAVLLREWQEVQAVPRPLNARLHRGPG